MPTRCASRCWRRLLAQRLKRQAGGRTRIDTTIDAAAQSGVEALLADRARLLPPRVSLAALVLDNRDAAVLAYAGSADFGDEERFSHVDMVRASRSPGSTLKPFLYAFALDEGLIHSESLLSDTPQSFSGYQPGNFQQSFHGPVSVSEALVKSLNVPAVEVLEQLGPARFVAMLRRGGLGLDFPAGAAPNLSVILGGAGASLEDLTGAYAALARAGMAVAPRYTADMPLQERRMMSEGAAFIVRDILQNGGPLGRAAGAETGYGGIAWKTGTSFGFRDAWAVGVSDRYTVGVWVGRPDGTPNPGFFGANVAAPLLVDIFNAMPDGAASRALRPPASVAQERICWPLGTRHDDKAGAPVPAAAHRLGAQRHRAAHLCGPPAARRAGACLPCRQPHAPAGGARLRAQPVRADRDRALAGLAGTLARCRPARPHAAAGMVAGMPGDASVGGWAEDRRPG